MGNICCKRRIIVIPDKGEETVFYTCCGRITQISVEKMGEAEIIKVMKYRLDRKNNPEKFTASMGFVCNRN